MNYDTVARGRNPKLTKTIATQILNRGQNAGLQDFKNLKFPQLSNSPKIYSLSLDACLREAASAKAGERACPVE